MFELLQVAELFGPNLVNFDNGEFWRFRVSDTHIYLGETMKPTTVSETEISESNSPAWHLVSNRINSRPLIYKYHFNPIRIYQHFVRDAPTIKAI